MFYDIKIFEAINGLANHSKVLDSVGIFLADYLPYLLGVFLLSFLFWPKKDRLKNRKMVFIAAIAAIFARFIIKPIILLFYARSRPYMTFPSTHKLIPISVAENLQSFPSGHALFFFALSVVIYGFNKRLGIICFASSIIMGIARIFVGVHWPSDILSGAVLGIASGLFLNWLYIRRQH